jgi:hypothetical protein
LLGSEGFLVNTGWPYERILKGIIDQNQRTPEEVANRIVKEHIDFYKDHVVAGISTDCSAVKLVDFAWDDETEDFVATENIFKEVFVEKFSTLVNQLKARSALNHADGEVFRNAVLLAHWEAQCYNDDQYVDIWDFCDRLNKQYKKTFDLGEDDSDAVTTAIADVKSAVETVVLRSCYSGPAFQYSRGLSVYFPWAHVNYVEAYDSLAFGGATGWNDFLKDLLTATKRAPRPGAGAPQDYKPVDPGMLIIKQVPPWTKGGLSGAKAGGTKNHPHKFYASETCSNNPAGEGPAD